MKFYTSDPHFFHGNSIKNSGRPFRSTEEMDETLIRNWNKRIKNEDEVYIIGDLTLSTSVTRVEALLKRLNGRKYLIEGNHDRFQRKKAFDKSLFEAITPYMRIKDGEDIIILSHYPIAVWDRKHYGSYHYHGHIHNNPLDLGTFMDKSYNVGVDVNHFAPVTHGEIKAKLKLKRENRPINDGTRELYPGAKVRHFKGNDYTIINIGEHVEYDKQVIYSRDSDNVTWIRSYDEFMSTVDRNKYPDVKQKYRFEIIK